YDLSDSIQQTIFDHAQYRAYYEKQYRDDPSTPSAYHWMQVLQIGRNYQAFLDYGALRSDSIWNASVKARKKYGEFEAEDKAASRATLSHLKLIFDRSKGMINAHEKIFINKYHYTEPIPQLQWTMVRGDSTVLGYPCHKATMRFRGRDYIAWYTEEIPFPYGPFKFGGLPGLITCIYDTQREHIYTLVGFEKAPSEDYIYEEARRMWFETKREVVAKLQRNYHDQPDLFTSDIVVRDPKNKPVKHHSKPYNPIELE
ncbi:GLPGLI family protein, partial [Porphyromonas sp.]|uniref:GLPGLI family protein n=1 Tax=Porphyromonas sp. TaxID=1924944 RepID=UPI001CB05945